MKASMKLAGIVGLFTGATLAIAPLSATAIAPPTATIAQDPAAEVSQLIRAKNTARTLAEAANGGLMEYRAEPAMHGPITEAPYIVNGDGTVTFTFFGGPPEAVSQGTYTLESEVTVDIATGDATLDYNGDIRASGDRPAPSSSNAYISEEGEAMSRYRRSLIWSRNAARTAAEAANGGLSQYRAEPAMHGPAPDAPFEENEDGTFTFTFQGGAPEEVVQGIYTVETVVTVDPDQRQVDVDYNGPVRE